VSHRGRPRQSACDRGAPSANRQPVTLQQAANALDGTWRLAGADDKCPEQEARTRYAVSSLKQGNRLVMHGVNERRFREDAAVQMIGIQSRRHIVIHRHRRVINEAPARAPYGQADTEFPIQLSPGATQPSVESDRP